mgnify:FL=1
MDLKQLAKEIRKDIFKTAYNGGSGHLGGAFSCVEILVSLYFSVLKYDKNNPLWKYRDKVIFSKGHGCLALYSVLNKIGYISKEQLNSYCKLNSNVGGEPKYMELDGVEATTGSLGRGLSFSIGIAIANKLDKIDSKIYTILGDGECQEGTVWEAVMSAGHRRLDNLTVILDYNKLQAMGNIDEILNLGDIKKSWESFGFFVYEVDGHNIDKLIEVLKDNLNNKIEKPRLIIANTIKGKGISIMENQPIWHYRLPSEKELDIFLNELEMTKEELFL